MSPPLRRFARSSTPAAPRLAFLYARYARAARAAVITPRRAHTFVPATPTNMSRLDTHRAGGQLVVLAGVECARNLIPGRGIDAHGLRLLVGQQRKLVVALGRRRQQAVGEVGPDQPAVAPGELLADDLPLSAPDELGRRVPRLVGCARVEDRLDDPLGRVEASPEDVVLAPALFEEAAEVVNRDSTELGAPYPIRVVRSVLVDERRNPAG